MKIIADRFIVLLDNQPPPLRSVCILVTAHYTSPTPLLKELQDFASTPKEISIDSRAQRCKILHRVALSSVSLHKLLSKPVITGDHFTAISVTCYHHRVHIRHEMLPPVFLRSSYARQEKRVERFHIPTSRIKPS